MQGKEGAWKCKNSSFQVAHVAASEPGNQESARPGGGSESKKCWLTVEQNSALVAKNKVQNSCSLFKPLLGLPQLGECTPACVRDETRAATLEGHLASHQHASFSTWLSASPVQTFSIPRPRPHTRKPSGGAGHKHTFSQWGEQVGRWGGGRSRTRWREGNLMNASNSMPGGQQTDISLAINLRKAISFKQGLICSPVPLPPCQSPDAKTNWKAISQGTLLNTL